MSQPEAPRYQIEIFARRETIQVAREREDWFFKSIRQITDHDEATARAMLNYGPIVTERYSFSQIPARR